MDSPSGMSLLLDGSQISVDKDQLPLSPATITKSEACQPDHCYHAFDTLYCALTDADPVPPVFENNA